MQVGVMLRHLGERGGIVTYSRNLVRGLIDEAPEDHFHLLYQDQEQAGSFGESPNLSEHVLPGGGRFWWDQWSVPRAARRLGLEVIINPKLSVPLYCPVPSVLVLRPEQFVHPELFRPWDRRYFKFFMPRYCQAASRIIAPTQQAAEDIVRFVGADRSKLRPVHEGCGEHFFAPPPGPQELERVRRRYRLPQRYVLFVGGITPLKNLERLVEAFGMVRERHQVTLVVVGFKRWRFERDISFARQHEVADHIHFTGYVEDRDMPQVFRLARVLFFPSIYEGFGIPVPEGFATGCPVVTTTRGCTPEVAGQAAELVDPFDVGDMARGLDRVLSDPAYRRELIARGLARAGRFRFSRVARQTLEVLQEAAQG